MLGARSKGLVRICFHRGLLLWLLLCNIEITKKWVSKWKTKTICNRRVCFCPIAWTISHRGAAENIEIAEAVVDLVAFQFTAVFQPFKEPLMFYLLFGVLRKFTLREVNICIPVGPNVTRNV